MFKIGDYAVCPGHGVGQVCDIETRDIGSEEKSFYIIKIFSNGMTVMVPTDSEMVPVDLWTTVRLLKFINYLKTMKLRWITPLGTDVIEITWEKLRLVHFLRLQMSYVHSSFLK